MIRVEGRHVELTLEHDFLCTQDELTEKLADVGLHAIARGGKVELEDRERGVHLRWTASFDAPLPGVGRAMGMLMQARMRSSLDELAAQTSIELARASYTLT